MSSIRPPQWASRFLAWFCDEDLLEEIQGDLEEAFHFRRAKEGQSRAQLQYIRDVFSFFKPFLVLRAYV